MLIKKFSYFISSSPNLRKWKSLSIKIDWNR
jgi:hypothetical protein